MAAELAAKSPLALTGTKAVLLRSRGALSVPDALDYVATWNSAQLVSHDMQAVLASLGGKGPAKGSPPTFSKL